MPSTDTQAGLTPIQWQVADAIARFLVLAEADVNELRKAIAYLRAYCDRNNASSQFFTYLKTLVRNGDRIGHSNKTKGYYQSIDDACSQYLKDYQDDASTLLQILGWAARLMQYYRESGPIGELNESSVPSEREAAVQAVSAAQDFQIGQVLEATIQDIKAIQGNKGVKGYKVTYEMLGTIRLTEREPKQLNHLQAGQCAKVEIVALKEDGSLKKVKWVGNCD